MRGYIKQEWQNTDIVEVEGWNIRVHHTIIYAYVIIYMFNIFYNRKLEKKGLARKF